tara:strand:+ start:500 stop:877 length:378 start_codon:yes stop_codon:yes gene_type:complete
MENFFKLSQRQLRVGEQVRQIISNFFIKESLSESILLSASIIVSKVKMSKDLKLAYVYIMSLGGTDIDEVKNILNSNKFLFQKELGKKLKTKFTPKITFYVDDTFLEAEKINNLLSIDKVKKDLN